MSLKIYTKQFNGEQIKSKCFEESNIDKTNAFQFKYKFLLNFKKYSGAIT